MSPATLTLPFPLPTTTPAARHHPRRTSALTSAAARRPLRTATVRTDKKKQRQQSNAGFGGGEKKDTRWRCVEGCGACCKLDKAPSFPSPEEIFSDPSHVEVLCPFCTSTFCFEKKNLKQRKKNIKV